MTYTDFVNADLNEVVSQLSRDEKLSLLAGVDWWTTAAIARLGIPSVKCSDGPNGVRGKSHFSPTPATCIPCATALGASFDTSLLETAGHLLADECAAKGASLLLGPTINLQRHPLNGRAFECPSEDPFLSGHIAAGYIKGLQERGIGATVKHFVGNDQEHQRFSVDVKIPERALREIYLMPFMLTQKIARPWAFMTSYSRVNGKHVSENPRFLQDILRDEWKFNGLVVSDWFGTYSTVDSLTAGLDLEMPGPTTWRGDTAKRAMNAGLLSVDTVDARVKGVLGFVQRACQSRPDVVKANREKEKTLNTAESRRINRSLASAAIVLLKNERNVLPFRPDVKSIAVIGPNAKCRTVSGGGSAYLTSNYVVTPYEGLKTAAEARGIKVEYSAGCKNHLYLPMLDGWMTTADGQPGWSARFYNEDPRKGGKLLEERVLPGSRLRINDEKPKGLSDKFYLEIEAHLVAPESGPFEFGFSLAGGRGAVSLNGKPLIDNGVTGKQRAGTSFYGLGTVEETNTVDLVKGESYKLEVFYTCAEPPQFDSNAGVGQPALMMAALRVGCAPKLDATSAMVEALKLAKDQDAVVCVVGTNLDYELEGSDRPTLALPGDTDELVARLLEVRPDAVIVNQSGSAVAMPWINQATTVVQSWFGGDETGNAIADALFGEINPAGRMPLTFPYQVEQCTAHLNWQAEAGKVSYGENIFVGYRGYEETAREVMFAFGEGLSYTSFEWSELQVSMEQPTSADDVNIVARLSVTNTGDRAGSDVIQIYVTDPECTFRRPKQELKGFSKVLLQPGETKEVVIEMDKLAFAYYDDGRMCWVAEQGEYLFKAAKSSRQRDAISTATVTLGSTLTWTGI